MNIFKDATGKTSYSRISGAIILIANLAATLKISWADGATQLPDIPLNWGMLIAALYGLHVFGVNKSG